MRAWRVFMSHVTHLCDVMKHIWTSHTVTHLCDVLPHIWMSHISQIEWVMPHRWMSRVTFTNESHHTNQWVVSHNQWVLPRKWMIHVTWSMSHATQMSRVPHTIHSWVTSHISMSHVTYINESCHTYQWVMSHIPFSHATHMNESCHMYQWVKTSCWTARHTYERVMSHIWLRHITHMNEPCQVYKNVTSHNLKLRSADVQTLSMQLCECCANKSCVNESCDTWMS